MKLKPFAFGAVLLLALTNLLGLVGTTTTYAETGVISERWGKPTFVAGAGLSEAQKQETMNLLGITADQVNAQVATGADLIHYLGSGSGDDSVMLSSVVVTRENSGAGLTVDIVTPENITLITADQYKNPLITAGITDATVKVGSVAKVTGESALTGVYKAFEANGETVDTERAQVAQQELETTADVAADITENALQNEDQLTAEEQEATKTAYQTQLNQALIDIKKELAELKEQQSTEITEQQLTEIVKQALENNNLSEYVSTDSINQLVALARQYVNTEGILSKEALAQLDKLSAGFSKTLDDLGAKFGDLTDSLQANRGFFADLWQSIKDFFSNLFN